MTSEEKWILSWTDRIHGQAIVLDLRFEIRTPHGYQVAKGLKQLGFEGVDVLPTGDGGMFEPTTSVITASVYQRRGEQFTLRAPKALGSVETSRSLRHLIEKRLTAKGHADEVCQMFHMQYLALLDGLPTKIVPEHGVVGLNRFAIYAQVLALVEIAKDLRV